MIIRKGNNTQMEKQNDIYIKAPVSGWHKATKEQAYRFAQIVLKGAWCSQQRVIIYLNQNLLRGISFTIEELLNGH